MGFFRGNASDPWFHRFRQVQLAACPMLYPQLAPSKPHENQHSWMIGRQPPWLGAAWAAADAEVARQLRGHALFGAVFQGTPAEMGIEGIDDPLEPLEAPLNGSQRPLVLLFKPKEMLGLPRILMGQGLLVEVS